RHSGRGRSPLWGPPDSGRSDRSESLHTKEQTTSNLAETLAWLLHSLFFNFLGARWERSVRRALLQCAINVGTRRRNYPGQSRPLLFAFLEHSWIRRTNNKCNSFFPDTLELIGSHGHVAEGRVGQNYAIAEDAADNHEVVHTFAVNGDDDRDLQVGQLFKWHFAEAFRAVSPRLCEAFQVQQRETSKRPHLDRVCAMQNPDDDGAFRSVVFEVVGEKRAKDGSAAGHVPLLAHDLRVAYCLQRAHRLGRPDPVRIYRYLSVEWSQEEDDHDYFDQVPHYFSGYCWFGY